MRRKRKSNTKIINNTKKPLNLYDENDVYYGTVEGNGGRASFFSAAQVQTQRDYANRVVLEWKFVKCMEKEQEVIELLKDHMDTYYALNIMKHFLVKEYNVLVKADDTKFTVVDLAEVLGVTRQSANTHMKLLKELNIVKKIKTVEYGTVFAINPDYYMNGGYAKKEVYDLFGVQR